MNWYQLVKIAEQVSTEDFTELVRHLKTTTNAGEGEIRQYLINLLNFKNRYENILKLVFAFWKISDENERIINSSFAELKQFRFEQIKAAVVSINKINSNYIITQAKKYAEELNIDQNADIDRIKIDIIKFISFRETGVLRTLASKPIEEVTAYNEEISGLLGREISPDEIEIVVNNTKNKNDITTIPYSELKVLLAILTMIKIEKDEKSVKKAPVSILKKPIFANNEIEIYPGLTPADCATIKDSFGIPSNEGWCVGRRDNNLWYHYRNRTERREPTFYFGRKLNVPLTEIMKTEDPYTVFALQIHPAHCGGLPYTISNKFNDGIDKDVSWDNLKRLIPELDSIDIKTNKHFTEIFNPEDPNVAIPLSRQEKQFTQQVVQNRNPEFFCKLNYLKKKRYIDIKMSLSDEEYKCADDSIQLHYINLRNELTPAQIAITSAQNIKRYEFLQQEKMLKNTKQLLGYLQVKTLNGTPLKLVDRRLVDHIPNIIKEIAGSRELTNMLKDTVVRGIPLGDIVHLPHVIQSAFTISSVAQAYLSGVDLPLNVSLPNILIEIIKERQNSVVLLRLLYSRLRDIGHPGAEVLENIIQHKLELEIAKIIHSPALICTYLLSLHVKGIGLTGIPDYVFDALSTDAEQCCRYILGAHVYCLQGVIPKRSFYIHPAIVRGLAAKPNLLLKTAKELYAGGTFNPLSLVEKLKGQGLVAYNRYIVDKPIPAYNV